MPRSPRWILPCLIASFCLPLSLHSSAAFGPKVTETKAVWTQSIETPTFGTAQVVWMDFNGELVLWDPVFPEGVRAVQKAAGDEIRKDWRYVIAPRQPEAGWLNGLDLQGATLISHRNFVVGGTDALLGPKLAVNQSLRLESGDRVIEIHALGRGLSDADLVAYLPRQKLVLGGLLCSPSTALPSDLKWTEDWLALLRRMRSLGGAKIIPAQGAVGGIELIDRQIDVLQARNSSVAIAVEAGDRPKLVFVAGRRSPEELAVLKKVAPNVEIRLVGSRQEALQYAAKAHGIEAHFLSSEFLRQAPNLRWVQAYGAGVESYLANPDLRDSKTIVMANMKGTHGPAIADHAFAMLLTLTRRLRFHENALAEKRWDRGRELRPEALHGKTMLVVGLGGIGHEVARRAHGFGMTVLATTRTEKPLPAYVDRLGLAADFENMLPLADVVAICVPLTPATEGMFGAEQFAQMKQGSYLINVARGRIVDSDALNRVLRSGHLGGACLDVTDPEPLPESHALWTAPNLVLTPHVSGRSEVTQTRKRALFLENMRRFSAGENLLNVVNKSAGY
jgi:phosphoglycerate dehydrogenase-like enzyme